VRKDTLDLREKALGQMALGDETVRTVAEAFVGKREAVEFGEDDQAQARAGETDSLGSFETVDPGHAEIEEYQIRLVHGRELDRVQAVTGGTDDLKATGEFEVVADGTESRWRIVSDENANFRQRHCFSEVGHC
jgi:hypothetical protein